MRSLNPYINFNGRCREAITFYQRCFGGEIVDLRTFGQTGMPCAPGQEDQVIHSEFRAEGIHLMGTDGAPECPAGSGSQISLTILLDDAAEQDTLFAALADGGSAIQPPELMFWGDRYGSLTDRFGVNWALNCTHAKA